MSRIAKKWRPPMALGVMIVCGSLLAVPLVAIFALQIGTNRFVNETEASLIQQASIYAGAYAAEFEAETRESGGTAPGFYLPPDKRVFWNAETRTFQHLLDLRRDTIEPVRPDAVPTDEQREPRYLRIAPLLGDIDRSAGRTTLSAVNFLDYRGLDLLAPDQVSFAAVAEVQQALRGEVGAALRWRSDSDARVSFTSFSRGTGFRVLVAYPVISSNRVIGVVYMSRTPPELARFISEESLPFIILAAVTLCGAALIGSFLVRTMLRPLRGLRDQSRLVAEGAHEELAPLRHYGMREIAELGEALMTMAGSLARRRREIGIYTNHVTHELKSPVASILGATELLEDGGLPEDAQRKLLATIRAQGARMDRLLGQLREITRSRQHAPGEPGLLSAMLPDIPALEIRLVPEDAIIPLSVAHGETVLAHLAQNASHHGATRLEIGWDGRILRISDNGEGFSERDLARLGEPFFTTRRADGGTGLGLTIVSAILELYAARLTPVRAEHGAVFDIEFA